MEFAPEFAAGGGFDLQVGNPPWVRLDWQEDLALAELDPWWGVTDDASPKEQRARRAADLAQSVQQVAYLTEVVAAEGVVELLGSPIQWPTLAGIRTNLYMAFMDITWRHISKSGTIGLIHPESHLADPKAGQLRRSTYVRLRRHFSFRNELRLFDIGNTREFGLHISGPPQPVTFIQVSNLFHPDTVDRSMTHDGHGELPGIQHRSGGWDLRPHKSRLVLVDESRLAEWALLFDLPGLTALEAKLVRPLTNTDLGVLSVFAAQSERMDAVKYDYTSGWNETNGREDGTFVREIAVPRSWNDVIFQGAHLWSACPVGRQPRPDYRTFKDVDAVDLETIASDFIPRTVYQPALTYDLYQARMDHWGGTPAFGTWRVAWRRMIDSGMERSLVPALLPPGAGHIHGVHSQRLETQRDTARCAGLWASIPMDYLVRVSGKADVQDELVQRLPWVGGALERPLLLRALRLNCLTEHYSVVWEELWDPLWCRDRWTDPKFDRRVLGDVNPGWSMTTPLRRDFERRLALVELDALAALMLGLTGEQLGAMYRAQFAVLRKYEFQMVFDGDGRKICGHYQSAGARQVRLQNQARSGELPPDWKSIWRVYEQYEADPDSVDWLGYYTPPFYRPDREAEMTRAYNEFQRRLDAGEYE